jgi:hypothetical protein
MGKVDLQICGLNGKFHIEWHSILSGGKPTFPTCEFPSLEWYHRAILFFTASEVGGIQELDPCSHVGWI